MSGLQVDLSYFSAQLIDLFVGDSLLGNEVERQKHGLTGMISYFGGRPSNMAVLCFIGYL